MHTPDLWRGQNDGGAELEDTESELGQEQADHDARETTGRYPTCTPNWYSTHVTH